SLIRWWSTYFFWRSLHDALPICTAIVGGRAIRSCVTLVESVDDAEVVTLEGLGTPEAPHPIQQAFIDEQAAQCGFCLNGVILTADRKSTRLNSSHVKISYAVFRL